MKKILWKPYWLLFIMSCITLPKENKLEQQDIDYAVYFFTPNSQITHKQVLLIDSKQKYDSLLIHNPVFRQIISKQKDSLNFKTNSLILIAIGEVHTGGFDIKISKLYRKRKSVFVDIKKLVPSLSCVVTEAFQTPAMLISVSRQLNKQRLLEYNITEEIKACK